jgi:tetratricopeptide (TPR) repeat protein/DNA-binding CsgD family transcriptional regulator
MKKNNSFYTLILTMLVLFFFQDLSAQSKFDSLRQLVDVSKGIEKVKYLNALAIEYLNSDLDKAITRATMAHQLAENLKDLNEQAKATHTIADAWYYKNDLYKAIEFYKISAEAEKELKGPQSEKYAERLGDVGYCYQKLSLYDYADDYYKKALAIAQNINNVEETANNLNNLGHVNFAWGNYDKAISFFSRALILDKERNINEYISIDFNNIGKVYFAWKKYDRALEYYDLALEKAVISGNRSMQAIRLSNIGQVYEAMNNYDTALDYLNRALEMDKMLGHNRKVGIRLSNIGMVFIKQGKYDDALRNFNQALEIFKNSGLLDSQAITYNNLGELMCRLNNYQKALGYYNQSLNISHRIGLKPQELRSLHNISTVYEKLGEYQNSLDFFKRFSALNDSIFNKEKHKQIAEFEARYDTEKKEKENTLLKHEAKIHRNQKIIFIISGVAMLVMAILFVFLFTTKRKSLIQSKKLRNREKELHRLDMEKREKENEHLQQVLFAEEQINKLQKEKLQQKNRELSTATLHILNKNEVLGNIKKIARQAVVDDEADKQVYFTNLIHEIDNNTNLDEQWDQFKLHFESVHKGFFVKLNHEFSNLTQNELKLCAYLRMNLSTKEIAQMLHISPESVTTKRYRLRKKLKLDNEENLVGFIRRF